MIYILNKNKRQLIKPTIFPDGTSQVWKLELNDYANSSVKLIWHFENEAELIWLNQTIALLNASGITIEELYIPYLPYARQDKPVSNSTTFAKEVFLQMILRSGLNKITTLDAHSNNVSIQSYSALPYIAKAIAEYKPNVLVFPDAGAYARYAKEFNKIECSILVLDKVRDQESGVIKSLILDVKLSSSDFLEKDKSQQVRMLIIDDICDGGATFISASLYLHQMYDCEVCLYVTHGIYSKGFESLINSGISRFYTTQSLIKNTTAYALEEF